MTTFYKPIRVRSKICVLLYKNYDMNTTYLKEFLRKQFSVKSDETWDYIFKLEKSSNRTDVLVFLNFKNIPDVYSNKLTLRDVDIEPSVWCFQEKTFPLYSLLKFNNTEELKENMVTNINQAELNQYVSILEASKPAKLVSINKIDIRGNPGKTLKSLGTKQTWSIEKHMTEIDTLVAGNTKNFTRLKTVRQNIVNYKTHYIIPPELDKRINNYWKRVTEYTSSKNPKNQNF